MGASRIQGIQNYLQYRRSFLEHLIVPESNYPKPTSFDSMIAARIVLTAFEMLSAIKLDHKFCVKTRKIRDISANGHLPTKAVTSELSTPQMLPEMAFSIGGLISQSSAATLCKRITHATNYPAFCPLPTLPRASRKGGNRVMQNSMGRQ